MRAHSTFDIGGHQDGTVTEDEFVNYYNNMSRTIDNDDYFELIIRNMHGICTSHMSSVQMVFTLALLDPRLTHGQRRKGKKFARTLSTSKWPFLAANQHILRRGRGV
jgi:hypothetical protein